MAGHSKWANIQHRKGAQDKKRGKIFSKLSKEITVAAKMGGGDPDMNPRLRLAIKNAKGQSMPNNNIDTAIKKGVGATEGDSFEEARYEGYGPGGVAIMVEVLTDNKNRAATDMRTIFSKNGGNLGETGSVTFMFDHMGEVFYPADKASGDEMFEAAVEAGAENVESDEDGHIIYTSDTDLAAVRDELEKKYGDAERSGLIWKPNLTTEVDAEKAESLLKLVDLLEDNDDVQSVTTNMDASDEVMEALLAAG